MKKATILLCVMLAFTGLLAADSISVSKLSKAMGYTIVEVTQAKGEFNGADYGKTIALDNGWVFEFREYGYSYAYRPDVVIFGKRITDDELRQFGLKPTGQPIIVYKLLVDGDFYDASRIK